MARFQRRDQRGGVNQLAAAGIDDEYPRLRPCNCLRVQQMERRGNERQMQREDVASRQ